MPKLGGNNDPLRSVRSYGFIAHLTQLNCRDLAASNGLLKDERDWKDITPTNSMGLSPS
jgi:hypothetical protein